MHRGRRVEELGEVRHAADLRDALAVLQPRADLHHVDRLAHRPQLDGRLEDAPVRFAVEVLRPEELEHFVERHGVEHHRGEDRGLGVEIIGRNATIDDQRLHEFCASFPHAFPRHHSGE